MKHNYKINIDRPLPSDAQIARHKDFGRILADYHNLTQPIYRKPLYKNPKAFIGLVLIASIAMLVFWTVDQEDKEKEKAQKEAALPVEIRMAEQNSFLKAPLPALQVPATTIDVNPAKPQQLALANGTLISIPANALGTTDGQQVIGVAHLKVRQISSIAEIIAMGLPMDLNGQTIRADEVFEISATSDSPEGPKALALTKGQKISVEVPVAADAMPAQLYRLDLTTHQWMGGTTPIASRIRKQNVASMNPDDGFGVVEYDAEGKVIPKKKPAQDSLQPEIKVMQFSIDQLGTVCLGNAIPSEGGELQQVRFTDPSNQALRILTLYAVNRSANTVKFLWPKSADFVFALPIAQGVTTDYIGFLPDGRLAMAQNVVAMPNTQDIHVLQMKISDAPIQNLMELTQLIDQPTGL